MALRVDVIDCQDPLPQFSSVCLLTDARKGADSPFALVDCHSAHSLAKIQAQITARGLRPENLEWLFVTHAHLDHAGGAWKVLQLFPNAKLGAHPKAAKHLIDPSRLNQSARAVYGDQLFEKWYGNLQPIDPRRVVTFEDGQKLDWNGFRIEILHTRGHANHHQCLLVADEKVIFTGDSFGLAYPALPGMVFPSTSPTDFDSEEALKTYARIAQSGATTAYLTHFGGVTDLDGARAQLEAWIRFSQELLDEVVEKKLSTELAVPFLEKALGPEFVKQCKARGLDAKKVWPYIEGDLKLNARGLAFVAQKKLGSPTHGSN